MSITTKETGINSRLVFENLLSLQDYTDVDLLMQVLIFSKDLSSDYNDTILTDTNNR